MTTPSPSSSDSSQSSDGYEPTEMNDVTHALGLLSMGEDGNSVYRGECASSEVRTLFLHPILSPFFSCCFYI
jgi:hypothetical protein